STPSTTRVRQPTSSLWVSGGGTGVTAAFFSDDGAVKGLLLCVVVEADAEGVTDLIGDFQRRGAAGSGLADALVANLLKPPVERHSPAPVCLCEPGAQQRPGDQGELLSGQAHVITNGHVDMWHGNLSQSPGRIMLPRPRLSSS